MEKIDSKDIEAWNNAGQSEKLHMPHRNEFIPEKLDLVPREEVAKIYLFFLIPCLIITTIHFLTRLNHGQSP